ncbi:MAG TPA: adenine deaminase C-terminal domain-containing protein, partial [Holophaga sp.]|nr:adenine deaminase C-terminal domain-containing protein [Holophaga sp.]
MMSSSTAQDLRELIRAGRGLLPADLAIQHGTLVNVTTRETYPADIAIFRNTIVAVGDVSSYIGPDTKLLDARGKYLVPGLIDGHIHSECSKMSLTSFAKAVVPVGTTSIVSGLDEYISVAGLPGLREVLDEAAQLPMRVFWGAPFKTPYTFPPSTIAENITRETHARIQAWPECFGVWETVREFIQEEDEDALGAILEAGRNRLPVFGCAPMARGRDLNGYLCAGIRLDHESYSHEEVVEKIRKGMYMLIRESSVTHFLAENIRAITEVNRDFARRVSFCTDDVTATDVLAKGHLDHVVRLAIAAGVEPVTAIQMATLNSAEAYRIDHLVGSISPGKLADILVIDDPASFRIEQVVANGRVVARGGRLSIPLDPPTRSQVLAGSVKRAPVAPQDFEYRVPIRNGKAEVLSMDVKGPFVRKRRDATLQVKDSVILPDPAQDVLAVSVLERFGRNGNRSLAFCSGWGLKRGAMASSAAPDDNNIICLGTNAADMAVAVNHLILHGGGQVVVDDGRVAEFLPLP